MLVQDHHLGSVGTQLSLTRVLTAWPGCTLNTGLQSLIFPESSGKSFYKQNSERGPTAGHWVGTACRVGVQKAHPACMRPGFHPQHPVNQHGCASHTCTQEAEAGGHPWLHSESVASLGYMKPCLITKVECVWELTDSRVGGLRFFCVCGFGLEW